MTSHVITTMFAFVSNDNENGDEGIIAVLSPSGIIAPMVSGDMKLLPSMTEHADDLGLSYKIKFFKEVPSESIFN